MPASFSNIDYLIVLGYFALVFIAGFLIKPAKKIENYFLAGRKLTLPMFIATLVTTWYGNFLSMGELAYSQGLVMWLTQGFFWYLVYFFVAFF
ncbi:MAG: sodium:solute symporter family protein, partial [Candidatus Melainabacteria bacterium]|nr:sodium:solute symporter family protein [Candidatus Melainabacteria bacterium]